MAVSQQAAAHNSAAPTTVLDLLDTQELHTPAATQQAKRMYRASTKS